MSGSPIIQDGKLVGAVAHVLVNDSTRGYGIFIDNMPDAVGYNSAGGNSAPVFFSAPYVIMYFEEESLWIIQ